MGPDRRPAAFQAAGNPGLTGNGAAPMVLPTAPQRAFLEDGDEAAIAATVPGPGVIGFGEVRGRVIPRSP